MNAVLQAEGNGVCDCISKAPTYPVYRDTQHLPECKRYADEIELQKLRAAVTRLTEERDQLRAICESVRTQAETIFTQLTDARPRFPPRTTPPGPPGPPNPPRPLRNIEVG